MLKKEIIGEVFDGFAETLWMGLKSESIIDQDFDADLELVLYDNFRGKKVKITIEEIVDDKPIMTFLGDPNEECPRQKLKIYK